MLRALLLVAGLAVSGGLHAAEDYAGIPGKFFGMLEKGQTSEAIDFLYETNPWMAKNSDQVENLRGQLGSLGNLVGKYVFNELISENYVGGRLAHLVYLVGYERQPLRFEITLYRPADDWQFYGVSFDGRITDDLKNQANSALIRK